jgi:hypothetical protein
MIFLKIQTKVYDFFIQIQTKVYNFFENWLTPTAVSNGTAGGGGLILQNIERGLYLCKFVKINIKNKILRNQSKCQRHDR